MNKTVITAYSMKDAIAFALDKGITVGKNKTLAWKNAGCPVNEDFDTFAQNALEREKLLENPAMGLIVCTRPGINNTRLRPYKFINKYCPGPAKKQLVFQISRKDNLCPLALCKSKAEAIKVAKELVKTHGIDVICEKVYRVDENHRVAFEMEYAPSKGYVQGEYVVITA